MTDVSAKYDIAVIGGGIIGLAIAMRLSQEFPSRKTVVLEKEPEIAQHQTGHNSGVIHAGIYYAPGSQKANFCVTGGAMLRRFADERGIRYEDCGKVIVATNEAERPRLEEVYRRGTANGVAGLEVIGKERLRELEPHTAGVGAVLSPGTGIIDYLQVSKAYVDVMKENGGELLTGAKVMSITRGDGGLHLETTRGEVFAKGIINCAGLHADRVAGLMGVNVGVRIIPFRGEYLSLRPERAHLVKGLIYPVPDPRLVFLGVHFTKRIDGSVEAGPNAVLALAREGYGKMSFNLPETLGVLAFPGFWLMSLKYWKVGLYEQYRSMVKRAFVRSLQALVPEITGDDLYAPGAGVRAQAVDRRGRLLQDFSIAETEGAIHVLNAPSPGASASLAISRYIVDLAQKSFGLAA
ncbi:MAG: L-2-hydroxyglutarate oxidase [Chloroflexi bacterium]|nr:L-2-hydroxyglutarate oxidase [Chloroflexota bacterium]